MATERQTIANRDNSKHSTGPRTEEGKSKSSQNALRHGLAARGLIVIPGQESDFAALEHGLRASLGPTTALQEIIFQRALESAWNLERCRRAEAKLYLASADQTVDPLAGDENSQQTGAQYCRIQKYARQNENSLYKAIRELGKLQTERQYRHEAFPLTEEQRNDAEAFDQTVHVLSEVCSVAKITTGLVAGDRRNDKPKLTQRDILDQIKELTAPPSLDPDDEFQFEANDEEDDLAQERNGVEVATAA